MLDKRNNGLDLLRIISSVAVIVIHVNAIWYLSDKNLQRGIVYFIEMALNLLMRFSVPCFIMISGAFCLANEENKDIKQFYRKSFWKLGIPYIGVVFFWFLIYFYKIVVCQNDFVSFIKKMLSGAYGNLWFMPMLIGLYLITPALVRIKRILDNRTGNLLCFMLLFWAVLSNSTSNYTLPYSIGVIFSYLAYYWTGYVLFWKININKKILIMGWSIAIILIFVSMAVRLLGFDLYEYNSFISFFSPTIVVFSSCLFLSFKRLNLKRLNLKRISELTYFVYLIHTPIYRALYRIFGNIFIVLDNDLISIILLVIVTVLVSFLCAYFYKWVCDFLVVSIQQKINNK